MYARLASYAVLAAASAWAGWMLQGMRLNEHIATLQTEYATAQAQAVEKAHAETIRLQEQKDAAERNARARQSSLARDAAGARDALERVRNASTEALLLSGHSHAACIDRATAIKDVFDQCSGTVAELAATADRLDSDRQTLIEAWPK